MASLFEKYRPRTFDDVLGQDKAIARIKTVLAKGWGGRAWWITGESGTGKTTLARIIAAQGADAFCTDEMDHARELTVLRVRELERTLHLYGWGKGWRAIIINEAHGLRRDVVECFLNLLERLPEHACILFTTTKAGRDKLFDDMDDAGPLLSRCLNIELTSRGLADLFAQRVQAIAQAEGLDGKPLERYKRLAQDCRNNMRAMLCAVESGTMMTEGN